MPIIMDLLTNATLQPVRKSIRVQFQRGAPSRYLPTAWTRGGRRAITSEVADDTRSDGKRRWWPLLRRAGRWHAMTGAGLRCGIRHSAS